MLVDVLAPEYSQRWATAHTLADSLIADPPHGLVDVVASYEHVFVTFDPLATDHDDITRTFERRLQFRPSRPMRAFRIPVLYGGEAGPDLDEVADELGLRATDVVRLHSAEPWVVRFRGSPAGAPMMDGPRLPGPVARRRHPRTQVPPGSVGLSGRQCVIYPVLSPGGWRLIGRTPLRLFDLTEDPTSGFRAGDQFQFVPIDEPDWDQWLGRSPEPTDNAGAALVDADEVPEDR